VRARAVITSFTSSNPYTCIATAGASRIVSGCGSAEKIPRQLDRSTHIVVHTAAAKALLEEVVPLSGKRCGCTASAWNG